MVGLAGCSEPLPQPKAVWSPFSAAALANAVATSTHRPQPQSQTASAFPSEQDKPLAGLRAGLTRRVAAQFYHGRHRCCDDGD